MNTCQHEEIRMWCGEKWCLKCGRNVSEREEVRHESEDIPESHVLLDYERYLSEGSTSVLLWAF